LNYFEKSIVFFKKNTTFVKSKQFTYLKNQVMKATILQAEKNQRNLSIISTGRGHYRIQFDYKGKTISAVTTNTMAIDNFNSDVFEKMDGRNRMKEGYEDLCNEIIRKNSNNY
jgi:hypothetical protein